MPYKFIEHTADVQFQATGDTLEEAFKESLNALKETVCGNITILEQETKELKIQGTDLVNLLQKFLEEFLFLLDSEDFLVSQIKNISINHFRFSISSLISLIKLSILISYFTLLSCLTEIVLFFSSLSPSVITQGTLIISASLTFD